MNAAGLVIGCVILATVGMVGLVALVLVRGGQMAERIERSRWTR